jgi:hypothetical protein
MAERCAGYRIQLVLSNDASAVQRSRLSNLSEKRGSPWRNQVCVYVEAEPRRKYRIPRWGSKGNASRTIRTQRLAPVSVESVQSIEV